MEMVEQEKYALSVLTDFFKGASKTLTEIAASVKVFDGFSHKVRQKFRHSRKSIHLIVLTNKLTGQNFPSKNALMGQQSIKISVTVLRTGC